MKNGSKLWGFIDFFLRVSVVFVWGAGGEEEEEEEEVCCFFVVSTITLYWYNDFVLNVGA